ncbi:hypothetical protein Btru_023703 [Bulinus truncatus]|nr:hypothetical protein Btru_023703 [Bulinus truncatus]
MKSSGKKPPPPLDKGWAWMVVLGVFICTFIMVGMAKSYGIFLLAFREKFQAPTALAAMPMSLSSFVYAFGAPTALLLAEKFTARKVVIAGAAIALIGIALSSLLFSMPYVIVCYGICIGLGNSSFFGNGLVMIGKYFRKYRSLATGIGLAGASIGQFAMPPFIQLLLDNYGLSGTLLILSALYFNAAIAGALFRPIESYGPQEDAVQLNVNQAEDIVSDSVGRGCQRPKLVETVKGPSWQANDICGQDGNIGVSLYQSIIRPAVTSPPESPRQFYRATSRRVKPKHISRSPSLPFSSTTEASKSKFGGPPLEKKLSSSVSMTKDQWRRPSSLEFHHVDAVITCPGCKLDEIDLSQEGESEYRDCLHGEPHTVRN